MTIYRRRAEYNLLADPVNTLNDNELKDLLRRIKREHPNMGQNDHGFNQSTRLSCPEQE